MIRIAKQAVKRAFASRLGWSLLGPILREPGVIVLTYHRINGADRSLDGMAVEEFAAQMRWVRDHCDPIGPETIVQRVEEARRSPRPAVLVTFDDGYRDYHDNAYPILKELGIPALVFVATSFLDEGGMLWTETVQWACLSTKKQRITLPWSGKEVSLPDAAARNRLGEEARAHLKAIPDESRRASVTALVAALGDPPARDREMLTWDEVRSTLDITRYGGHSHTHPILSRLQRTDAEREIRTCRERIVNETGTSPIWFAYPNGRPDDYTPETREILRANGFTIAFSTSEGIAGIGTDWMAVKRLPTKAAYLGEFAWQSAGLSRS